MPNNGDQLSNWNQVRLNIEQGESLHICMHVCLNWAHRKTRTTKEVSIWSRRPLNGGRKGIYTQIDSQCKLNPTSIHSMVPTWLISFSLSLLPPSKKKLYSTQLFVHELFTGLTPLLISSTLAIVRCAVSVEGGMASIRFCRVINHVSLPTWLPFSAAHQENKPRRRTETKIRCVALVLCRCLKPITSI